jgi:transcriptional regulator with XRE-family HTH domain
MPEKTSQRAFAYLLQLQGLDLEKNAIQRIESGERFVTDIELKAIAIVLNVSVDELLTPDDDQKET